VLANFCREIKFYLQKKSIRLIRKWADPMRSVGVVVGAKRPDQILFWLWHRRRLSYQRNYPNLCRLVGVSHSVVVNIVAVALATRRHRSILQTVSFAVGKKGENLKLVSAVLNKKSRHELWKGQKIFAYPRFSPARRSSSPTFLSNCYADWLPWVNDRCFLLVEPWLTCSGQHY